VRIVIKLNVLDRTFLSANNTLVVLVVHLSGRDGVFSFYSRDHVSIVWWHDLRVLVSVSYHVSLGARNYHL